MAEVGRVSIRLPSAIKQGDVIRVRTLVIHPMELVQRDKQGKIIPKNYHFVQQPERRRTTARKSCARS